MPDNKYEPVAIVGMGETARNPISVAWGHAQPIPALGVSRTTGSTAVRELGPFLTDEVARLFDHSFFGKTGLEVELWTMAGGDLNLRASRLDWNYTRPENAMMTAVYAPVIYAFEHIARVREGQTVLAQSVTTGLAPAAVQVARANGGDVFAMVDSGESAALLVGLMLSPASHELLDHDLWQLHRATGSARKGISTSSSVFQIEIPPTQGFMLLAPLGHVIQVAGDAQSTVRMRPNIFKRNAHLSSFDPSIIFDDPVLGGELMAVIDAYYRNGTIAAMMPSTATNIVQGSKSFNGVTKSCGKLHESRDPSQMSRVPPQPSFDPEDCYSFAASLASRGISAKPTVCDISDGKHVPSMISTASIFRQLKEIVHAAVTYLDLSLDKLTILPELTRPPRTNTTTLAPAVMRQTHLT
ncbi:hypothetical protein BJX61DRAFT_547570 [Aspergillus egyptiacus]|nr:hypothetical protein BJX61DRAFT_547570 [Aspergillus egyptiacus]